MSESKPCPHCAAVIEPCPADVSDVLGPGAKCGEWGCAYARHRREDCPKGDAALKATAAEGLRLRREIEARIAPMRALTAEDLNRRCR